MVIYVAEAEVARPLPLGTEPWSLRGLTDVTVIFGRNGSGKSQLLRRFRSQDPVSRHYISPERGGDIAFNQERLASQFQGGNRAAYTGENAAPNFGEDAIARILAYLTKRGAQRGTDIGTPPEELEQLLRTILPEFVVTIRGMDSPYRLQRAEGGTDVTAIQALSSGEAQLFKIALDLVIICAMWELDNQAERILLIDEPDLHLHPDFQQRLAGFINLLAERFQVQVIIATHSTTMLAALGEHAERQTSIIYLNNADDVQQAVRLDEELQEMATCLGGHVLMGPLFGIPLLLVEGDDEYRIWSQVPRHPGAPKLAVIPCGGRPHMLRYQRTLERLFGAMLDDASGPVGFALVDGDHGPAPQPTPDHPQTHIPYLQLACHESENLYLTDEVLALLGMDWDTARARVREASHEFGVKQEFLAGIDSWDRDTHDLKAVINEVAQILDERPVLWSVRVGKLLGASRPSGQLAEFLGDPVVETFWGQNLKP